jgi:hypothetical protein
VTRSDPDLPDDLPLPHLPAAVEEWFAFVGDIRDGELILDGVVLDGLDVVDAESARRALAGYRYVVEHGSWRDAATDGGWDANWIVLETADGDPVIADVSTTDVAVSTARHGIGRWDPTPVAGSLHEFIEMLDVVEDVPGPPADDIAFDHSVWLVDLGPEPYRTLLRLQAWPMFPRMSRQELLGLRDRLPMRVTDGVTETVARNTAAWALGQGIPVEVRSRSGMD